jgi:hypothetical protein
MRAIVGLPLVLLGLTLPGSPSHAAAATCLGMPATIVGSPGDDVVGTEGPDVVIANGAGMVETLGGDDRVCVTTRGTFDVETGPGDDQVAWSTKRFGGSIDLGAGSDSYTGGDQGSYVDTGDRADARAGQPLGTDTVHTGSGVDTVITGHVSVDAPNADVVVLGRGRDSAIVRGAVPASLDGGGGSDELSVQSRVRGAWVVDSVTGVVSVDGTSMPPATSFARFVLAGLTWSSLEFHGGPGNERVTVSRKVGLVRTDGRFSADLGGGKDTLFVRSQDTGPFDGGEGEDSIFVAAKGASYGGGFFTAKLAIDRYWHAGHDKTRIPGFENLSVFDADLAHVVGDDAANRLGAYGCATRAQGLGGDDHIEGGTTKGCYDDPAPIGLTALGGPGDDVLEGSPGQDRLFGGPGRDKADGWYGRDQCVAEVRERCER